MYSLVIALMSALNIMQTTGVPQAITKHIAETPQHADAILHNGLILQSKFTLVLTVLYLVFTLPITELLNDQNIAPYIFWSSTILPIYGLYALYLGYHNGLHAYRRLAFANTIYSIVKFISILLLVFPFGLYGAISGFIVAPLIALFTCFKLPRSAELYSNDLISSSLPLIGYAILSNLLLCIDIFILKASSATELDVGYYAAAQNIAKLPYSVVGVVAYALFPAMAKLLASNDNMNAHKMLSENIKLVIYLLIPVTFMFAASCPQITDVIYGEKYLHSASVLPFLLIGGAILTFFNIFAYALNGAGMGSLSVKLAALGFGVSAICCFVLVRQMGMIGAAYGMIIGAITVTGLAAVYLNRLFKSFFPLRALAISMLVSTISLVPIIALKPQGFALLCAYLLFFGIYLYSLVKCKQINYPFKVRV